MPRPREFVQVLSLHQKENTESSFDLKDILRVLDPHLSQWVWCVPFLDAYGSHRTESLCRAVEAARPPGKWLSSKELTDVAQEVSQTIDGTFIAFPTAIEPGTLVPRDFDKSEFPTNRAQLIIEAVDGAFFDVYLKDDVIARSLHQHFPDVREQDLSAFFN